MKRLIFLLLALVVACTAGAANTVQVMTNGTIDLDKLPTLDFSYETDPASPVDGQIWWNETTKQLKVADAAGVYEFNGTLVEWDTTPTAFSFTDVANATTATLYTSAPITVAGINHAAAISVSGDASAKYSINNATAVSTNGTVESGDEVRAVVTSSASDATEVNATVTIGGVSDVFGVTTAAAESTGISDDFSTNTAADYTSPTSHTLNIAGGVVTASSHTSAFYHETSTGSNNNYSQAYVKKQSTAGGGSSTNGPVVRCNGTSGYIAFPQRGEGNITQFYFYKFTGTTRTFVGGISFTGGKVWADNEQYLVRLNASGSSFELEIDWNGDGDFLDANESDMTARTDSTYTSGEYIGFGWSDSQASAPLDNFSGGAL